MAEIPALSEIDALRLENLFLRLLHAQKDLEHAGVSLAKEGYRVHRFGDGDWRYVPVVKAEDKTE